MDRSADNLGQTISNIQRDLEELKSNQGNGSGGGGGGGGGEEYFAGNGINISQSNTISVDTNVVATQTDLESKQDTLTAGSHISISNNNTISATGIPTKISDLINDSDFSSIEIVNSLPSTGTENVLYLIPSASLPNGYQRYSYIDFAFKAPKTAYFPLTNVWTTTNWKMEFDFEIHENYDYNNIFGRLDAVDTENEIWANSANQYRWRAFGWTGPWDASMVGGTLFTGTRYVISHDNLGSSFVTVSNGNQTLSRAKLTGTAQSDWQFAFGHRNGGAQFYGKVFGYRSWDANGLVDDLVPARRLSDNKDGFYNLVDDTFRPLEGENVSEVIGGAWSSNAYNGFVWTGSAYIQIGRDVYATSQLINDSGFLTSVDWDGIEDKPTFATVATTGDYDDLTNKPTIPAAQVNSDWNSTSGISEILNKPTLATVATSGSYNDLTDKPTIPTVNNATLTIQKNGTTVQTFTANQSTAATANITVPTKTSDITNDSGFASYNIDSTCSEGKSINLSTAGNAPIASFKLDGETSQNGTPTPSAPVAVNTTTGENVVKICGKNLFDSSATPDYVAQQAWAYFGNGTYTAIANGYYFESGYRAIAFEFDSLIVGQQYTLSFDAKGNSSHNAQVGVNMYSGASGGTQKNYTIETTSARISFTFTATSANRIAFNSGSTSGADLTITNIQLEKGSSASSFEPYQGSSYEVNLGKNLLQIADGTETSSGISVTKSDGYISASGTIIDSWGFNIASGNNPLPQTLSAGTYTVSLNKKVNFNVIVLLRDALGREVASVTIAANSLSTTATLDREAVYNTLWSNSGQGVVVDVDGLGIQIEKGSTATTYAPYFTPIELCKIGDYQDYIYKSGDKWYKHKECGKVILDGVNKSFSNRFTTTGSHYRFVYEDQSIPNYSASTVAQIYCNRLIGGTIGNTYNRVERIAYNDANNRLISYIASIEDSTLAAANTWLESNHITVYYILATPTDTEITNQALITQLNALLTTARTYAGINNIFTITPNEQGTLEICIKGGLASPTLMTGATSSTAGAGGLVPAPAAGDQEKYLRGDGTWQPAGSSSDIPDGAVTTPKLASEAVTTAKIADSNVTTAKIADDAVTAAKIDWSTILERQQLTVTLDNTGNASLGLNVADYWILAVFEITSGGKNGNAVPYTWTDGKYYIHVDQNYGHAYSTGSYTVEVLLLKRSAIGF